jgi:hypothetical protein
LIIDLNDLKKLLVKSIDDLDNKAMRPLEAKMAEFSLAIAESFRQISNYQTRTKTHLNLATQLANINEANSTVPLYRFESEFL